MNAMPMRSRDIRRWTTCSCAAILALGLAACSHPKGASGTARDRAACAQLAGAYASFNAWTGGKPPIATYQKATTAARQADNPQLRRAILDWVGAMSSPSPGKSATGAPYATQECRQIGQPLSFGAPTQSLSPSLAPTTPTNPRSSTTEGDNEAGDGGN